MLNAALRRYVINPKPRIVCAMVALQNVVIGGEWYEWPLLQRVRHEVVVVYSATKLYQIQLVLKPLHTNAGSALQTAPTVRKNTHVHEAHITSSL